MREVMNVAHGTGVLFPMLLAAILSCSTLAPSGEGRTALKVSKRVSRIAVAPVTLSPALERRREFDRQMVDVDATTYVGQYLAEALLDRGIGVVTAHDSNGLLSDLARSAEFHRDASRLARVAVEQLGVDALLVVELTQWSSRDPGRSPSSTSAVGFRATLHGGTDGRLLWSGQFSESQVAFFNSPWRALQYPGFGLRWLSVTELARWGSRQLIDQLDFVFIEK